MKLIFYTHYYDNSNVECIVPPPSIKYKSYYFTNNVTMYNKLRDTSWNRVLDISLNIPFDPFLFEIFGNKWYIPTKIVKQYSILDNPQYYIDLSSADYTCIINYKTCTVHEKYVEQFIIKYFININQFCLIYKRFNNGMELLIKNLRHREINKRMTLLKELLTNNKEIYIL
jgi:hypothetical protein